MMEGLCLTPILGLVVKNIYLRMLFKKAIIA